MRKRKNNINITHTHTKSKVERKKKFDRKLSSVVPKLASFMNIIRAKSIVFDGSISHSSYRSDIKQFYDMHRTVRKTFQKKS